jgi:broad specificity phosphatase PhoE
MRRRLLAVMLFALVAVPVAVPVAAQSKVGTTVIVVRHAEKATTPADDPPLNAAGEVRAKDLVEVLRNAGVGAIITTQFARTRATAQPIASALGITPTVVTAAGPQHVQNVVAEIQKHPGQTVLVVGHSNTVPGIVELLGAAKPSGICDSKYDDLFVVTVAADGKAGVVQARYGEPSPKDPACAGMR